EGVGRIHSRKAAACGRRGGGCLCGGGRAGLGGLRQRIGETHDRDGEPTRGTERDGEPARTSALCCAFGDATQGVSTSSAATAVGGSLGACRWINVRQQHAVAA